MITPYRLADVVGEYAGSPIIGTYLACEILNVFQWSIIFYYQLSRLIATCMRSYELFLCDQ